MAAELTREQAAEDERHRALLAEARHHVSNVVSELRRYAAATQHAESVYRLRLGLPEPEPSTDDITEVRLPGQERRS